MTYSHVLLMFAFVVLIVHGATGQGLSSGKAEGPPLPAPRISLSGGLGVSYVNATDLVDRINGTGITTERVSGFTAGA